MQQKIWIALVAVFLGGALAAYLYMRQAEETAPASAPPPAAPQPPTGSATGRARPAPAAPRHPLPAPAAQLPELERSDSPILQALGEALGRKWLALVIDNEVVRRVVVTVDNLPREQTPPDLMPLKRVPKLFIASGKEESLAISPRNSARYARHVRLVGAIDAAKLVAVYVRFYPLFQKAYEELGYPHGYFNDRLVEAIDDLLASPEIPGAIKLVQPGVLYQFASADLEKRSAGQKLLLRMGRENASEVKAKLREIRRLVASGRP